MNPLVSALARYKERGPAPAASNEEMSLPAQDINMKPESGEKYVLCTPVICTASDGSTVSFKQDGAHYLETADEEQKEGELPPSKIPMVRTQTEPA